jgi:glycerol-3-phosphate acyltransferase PlsY
MRIVVALVIGYFAGSIPFALLLTRSRGVDLRRAGSHNVGAANVLRTTGVPRALTVLLLDAGKGAMAVLVARLLTDDVTAVMATGLAAIVGHVYPAWIGFRGGKGVAASAGVFAMLAPLATAIAALVFVGTIVITRFISAGSLAGAVALAMATAIGNAPGPVVGGAILAAVLVMYRHRDNVHRLIAGTERRIGLRL